MLSSAPHAMPSTTSAMPAASCHFWPPLKGRRWGRRTSDDTAYKPAPPQSLLPKLMTQLPCCCKAEKGAQELGAPLKFFSFFLINLHIMLKIEFKLEGHRIVWHPFKKIFFLTKLQSCQMVKLHAKGAPKCMELALFQNMGRLVLGAPPQHIHKPNQNHYIYNCK